MADAGYPVGVAVVVRNAAGEVLLGLRKKEQVWASFGGRLERGETVAEGALRELHEETGLRLDSLVPLCFSEGVKSDGTRFVMLYLSAECPPDQQPVNREPHATQELQWFPLYALPTAMWPRERTVFLQLRS